MRKFITLSSIALASTLVANTTQALDLLYRIPIAQAVKKKTDLNGQWTATAASKNFTAAVKEAHPHLPHFCVIITIKVNGNNFNETNYHGETNKLKEMSFSNRNDGVFLRHAKNSLIATYFRVTPKYKGIGIGSVIYLSKNKKYLALAGYPSKGVWILSKKQNMPKKVYDRIVVRAKTLGIDMSPQSMTYFKNGCTSTL
jgi:hypothetical protein